MAGELLDQPDAEFSAQPSSLDPRLAVERLDAAISVTDDRLIRRELRRQIAMMERELSALMASAFPRHGIEWTIDRPMWGPRILAAGELEQIRDALVDRLATVRTELDRRGKVEERGRALLEDIMADPAEHTWYQVSNEDIGEQGCRHWHVTPRWGLVGMLAGWWRVKISSGCP
ncbi:MAG: hypothetical protein ACR2NA_13185 [Solirubrobacterales bacterium]